MQFSPITFVLAKTVFRKMRTEVPHNRVAGHLRNHTRCGDTQAVAITIDDRGLRERKWKHWQSVDKDVLRFRGKSCDREPHRFMRRAQNVDLVDLDGINNADRPAHCRVLNEVAINFLAPLGQELF